MRPIACIGLGANLGDARASIEAALGEIAALPQTELVARSSLYRSEPIDAGGPDFVNAVACVRTGLAPVELLDQLQRIEARHGRQRPYRNAPRTLDLDLLLHGETACRTPRLELPHPRMHERAFVLVPLAEILPALHVPGHGALAALLPAVAAQRIDKLPG